MTCCSDDDNNPASFSMYQNATFGPSDDNLTPSIFFRPKVNGVAVDLTGYVSQFVMRPINSTTDTITLLSTDSSPNSRLIQDNVDGSIAPYFNADDVDMPLGQYFYFLTMEKSGETVFIASAIINVLAGS